MSYYLLQATYSTWIQGLPAVLVDVRPWALFVNLTGGVISFQEYDRVDKKNVGGVHRANNKSAFTPAIKQVS